MPIFRFRDKPGKGVDENAPPKTGLALFFEALFRNFFDFVKLSLLFTLFSIPIITIPAALTAMSKIAFLMSRDQHYFLWMDFRDTFKKEFVPATITGWIYFAALGLSATSTYASAVQVQNNSFLYVPLILGCASFVLLIMTGFYIFPMLAAIDLKPVKAAKNAFLLAILYQPNNIVTLIVVAVVSFLLFIFIPFSLILWPLFFFMFLCFTTTFCANAGITKYVLQQEEE